MYENNQWSNYSIVQYIFFKKIKYIEMWSWTGECQHLILRWFQMGLRMLLTQTELFCLAVFNLPHKHWCIALNPLFGRKNLYQCLYVWIFLFANYHHLLPFVTCSPCSQKLTTVLCHKRLKVRFTINIYLLDCLTWCLGFINSVHVASNAL